ncbi:acidic phospholipase A2 PLA-2-like [Limulus polyphemus]|uniref:Phospholipase A2 n=1 Tax=Limulus polyphemus TaxID=6850 RepID=A0ABM1BX98_LIMPO|nr:acidic phospholipase A2 PLA-2-like [Limulus polyphemus]
MSSLLPTLRPLLSVVFVLSLCSCEGLVSGRVKRHLLELGSMVEWTTGRNSYFYAFYGHWCGIGGKGNPVDAIDRCCMAHDKCYGVVSSNEECRNVNVYKANYRWFTLSITRDIVCGSDNDRCAGAICECDRQVALCFGQNQYNEAHAFDRLQEK